MHDLPAAERGELGEFVEIQMFTLQPLAGCMITSGNHSVDYFASPHWLPTPGPLIGYSRVVVGAPYPNGLAACMARVGMSDPRLAALAETTKQQIHKLRHGQRKLTVQWAKRLAPHLECTWQELIEGPLEPIDALRTELLSAFENMDQRDRERLVQVARNWELVPRTTTGISGAGRKRRRTG